MAHQEPIRKRPGGLAREIPDKLYFRIGEVAKLCEVPAYVLRFWEGEFPQLKPNKGGTGQRLYRRRDVEMALRIKTLLYDEGYTIAGARQAFRAELRTTRDPQQAPQLSIDALPQPASQSNVDPAHLQALQKDLRDLLLLLTRPAARPSVQPIRAARSSTPQVPTPLPQPHPIDRRERRDRADRRRPSLLSDSLFDHLVPDE